MDDEAAMTTDVNAPPLYVNGNPSRSSERVVSSSSAASNGEAAGTSCTGLFDGKSEQALEAFVASLTSESTSKPLVARARSLLPNGAAK
jgi:hypothetical protein